MKLNSTTLKKAESFLEDAGYVVRYEKGNFHSGYCILEDRKVVVINKYYETDAKVNTILEIISNLKIDLGKLNQKSKDFYAKIAQLKLEDL
ncbi:MAG: hypothetical protein ACI9O4_000040 [Chitinophagales bacterium]|jgi:hypothetical protein